ncbi:hypothetical protein ACIOWF_20200 [Cellulosimicrobium cellulans]|uniref:hypothetical protein n=1 Tax=Cellulosimicrobium cellulans TaxID=1710 RepID=UPI00382E9D0A
MDEETRETVVVWRAGTAIVVMPVGHSVWDPDDAPCEARGPRSHVQVAWLQELRTLLDIEHHVVCAPITEPDWLTVPEGDLRQVTRILAAAGYQVVVEDPLPETPHRWTDMLEADLQELLSKSIGQSDL